MAGVSGMLHDVIWRHSLPRIALVITLGIAPTIGDAAAVDASMTQIDSHVTSVPGGLLKVQCISDRIVRVAFARDAAFFSHPSLSVVPTSAPAHGFALAKGESETTLSTKSLKVTVNARTGAVRFSDSRGRPVLVERTGGRRLEPARVQEQDTFHVGQQWEPNDDESLYGLGQNQLGLTDIKGYDLELWQHNTSIVIPFLVSSRGYGIFWDNPSYMKFGDLRPFEAIPGMCLRDREGKTGGLTVTRFEGTSFTRVVETFVDTGVSVTVPAQRFGFGMTTGSRTWQCARWEGSIEPAVTGDYQFDLWYNGGATMWLDGKVIADHWRQDWLPWMDRAKVRLEAHKQYPFRLDWTREGGREIRLTWKTPAPKEPPTSLWSEVGDGVDYYFVYGPEISDVIAGYRDLTGQAPIMPRWAFGLWQSRQRYETQQQSLDVVKGFRERGIPFDNIVQDWFYWKDDSWGSHEFDSKRFPDPVGWIKAIHDLHAHLMISVWPKFYPGTKNFEEMHSRGFLYELNLKEGLRDWVRFPYTFYDAFNAEARKMFWEQMNRELFSKKVDAWWMDATEPDLLPVPTLDGTLTHMNPTALGPASRVLNAYPLLQSRGVYEGQRSVAPEQRVFILTRSAYAGQQRYAAAAWSGDITSTWSAMAKQVPAGLSFSISGMPYWTMDTGGFAVQRRFSHKPQAPADAEEWNEMNARWFEFCTFAPFLRVHGEAPYREMWEYGGDESPAYQAMLKSDKLRYAMLPYVYSVAGDVTLSGGTFMRPLVMDFRADRKAREVTDQFMFGPAFLVSPVTAYKARTRAVYLPATQGGWYEFWTGKWAEGGRTIDAPAPYDAMPLHVRAGSIIPFGPVEQYTGEKPADPLTLYVYGGRDGEFSLYEDDGLTYGYEKGAFARIPIKWDDAGRKLTIGERRGKYPGMLETRTMRVVLVTKEHEAAFSHEVTGAKEVPYEGKAVTVTLQ